MEQHVALRHLVFRGIDVDAMKINVWGWAVGWRQEVTTPVVLSLYVSCGV